MLVLAQRSKSNKGNKNTMWSFYKALFKKPRIVGAVAPSSRHLAKAIAEFVPIVDQSLIVELGPGTGVITKALLERKIPAQRIISIETFAEMAEELKQQFPSINVIQGDAMHLQQLLSEYSLPVSTIVSSIPMQALPDEVAHEIADQIDLVLGKQGRYIQYTYGPKKSPFHKFKEYHIVAQKRVWLNIPPARIDVYEAKKM